MFVLLLDKKIAYTTLKLPVRFWCNFAR